MSADQACHLAEGILQFDTRDQLKNISQTTLVMVGEEDIMATPSQSRELAEGILGAELVILPNLGHFCTSKDPKGVADRMASFLKRVDAC
ncbi:alpha/beta fold hydrolase [Chloroflexota bacterium]